MASELMNGTYSKPCFSNTTFKIKTDTYVLVVFAACLELLLRTLVQLKVKLLFIL